MVAYERVGFFEIFHVYVNEYDIGKCWIFKDRSTAAGIYDTWGTVSFLFSLAVANRLQKL